MIHVHSVLLVDIEIETSNIGHDDGIGTSDNPKKGSIHSRDLIPKKMEHIKFLKNATNRQISAKNDYKLTFPEILPKMGFLL
jgi:hypothetical protein